MKILLNRNPGLEHLFAEIDVAEIRHELKVVQNTFEKMPAKFKKLVCKPDYSEILDERIIQLILQICFSLVVLTDPNTRSIS